MTDTITGRCLCGNVTYRTQGRAAVVGHCYCEDCRRSSGTSHCTHVGFHDDGFEITGKLSMFDKPADSGNIVSRAFCPTCGSPILSRNSAMPGMVFVRASSLDDMNTVEPAMTVYAAMAPVWAHVDREHPCFDAEFPGLAQGKLSI